MLDWIAGWLRATACSLLLLLLLHVLMSFSTPGSKRKPARPPNPNPNPYWQRSGARVVVRAHDLPGTRQQDYYAGKYFATCPQNLLECFHCTPIPQQGLSRRDLPVLCNAVPEDPHIHPSHTVQ